MTQSWGVAGQLQPALKHTFGTATVSTAQSQATFAAAPAVNAVSIQTADITFHAVSNVTAVARDSSSWLLES
jgi:hypothetical protein